MDTHLKSNSTKILAFSGKKQSGKTSAVNFIFGMSMLAQRETDENGVERPALINSFRIDELGRLRIFTQDIQDNVFDPLNITSEGMWQFCAENIYPYVKMYYMADRLKQDVCMGILGLTYEQCYGTEEQKNSLTHLLWENMPGVIPLSKSHKPTEKLAKDFGFITHAPGNMTGREVMQFVGTNIFRKMYGDVWVLSTLKHILYEGSQLSLIGDIRFPNEVEGVRKAGGKVIRLTRNVCPPDEHESEKALDNYPNENYDYVLNNDNMSIEEQNKAVYDKLVEWNFFENKVLQESLT